MIQDRKQVSMGGLPKNMDERAILASRRAGSRSKKSVHKKKNSISSSSSLSLKSKMSRGSE